MRIQKTSISIREFLLCSGLALTLAFTGSVVFYHGASNALRNAIRHQLESVASTAAVLVDADLHRSINSRSDEAGPAYQKIKQTLRAIRAANQDIRFIYTMRKTDKPHLWQFVVDSEDNPKDMSHVGDKYDISNYPKMREAFDHTTSDLDPSGDKWGTWLSGYAPIRDKNGNAVAIIGVDMSLAQVSHEEHVLRDTAIRQWIVSLLTYLLLGLIVTKLLFKPVELLSRAVKRVRDGDLDFHPDTGGMGKIRELGESFDGMIIALKESRERLLDQVINDPLTGLFNHRQFHESLETEIDRARRYGRKLTLLFIDVDRFKSMNDTLGHPVGDSVLMQLANVLRCSLRGVDISCRYGGDEFAIIMPDTGSKSGLDAGERLRAAIEGYSFYAVPIETLLSASPRSLEDKTIHVTVTLGLAVYPDHNEAGAGLVMAADIALCTAKHISRNTVQIYEPAVAAEQRLDLRDVYETLHDRSIACGKSLSAAGDVRNRYTFGHAERVSKYALQVGRSLGLSSLMLNQLKVASLLHDIGKLSVSDSLLKKVGSLTKEEREEMRMHAPLGADTLRGVYDMESIIPAVTHHHERYDGLGYPAGISGDRIPLTARILAVADSFDAMTSDRPYRRAMTPEAALLELQIGAGTQFDPEIVEIFVRSVTECEEQAA